MAVFRIFKYTQARNSLMKAKMTVQVPVKRYLKKYWYATERIPYDAPIDPASGGPLSLMVNLLFTGKTDMNFVHPNNQSYNDTLPIIISLRRIDRYSLTINDRRLQFLHNVLHRSFHEYVLTQVMTRHTYGHCKQTDTLHSIMKELDIVDDIDFDTLKKAVYRKKKAYNLPLFS